MFNKYYENELQKLREQAVEFAKNHPVAAPLLMAPSIDPSAERMLEGVAFLSGLLNKKLDDEFHKFIKETIEVVYPHFVRPIPATSIVLFEPKPGQIDPVMVRSGTLLSTNKVEDTSCQFQTLFDIEVNPVQVISTQEIRVSEKITQIEVVLQLVNTTLNNWNPQSGLYFFVGGAYNISTRIFMLLHHYLKKIILKSDTDEYILQPSQLKYVGLDLNNPLLDFPVQSFSAFRMLQEYFVLPQKFTLMALTSIDKWKNRGPGSRFSICFELYDIPEALPRLNKDIFIFNSVPVINQFNYEMDPINLDHTKEKILLKPNTSNPKHYRVYDVVSVSGYKSGEADKTVYLSMSSFKGVTFDQQIYQLIRDRSIVNNEPVDYLFFPYRDNKKNLAEETLSITLKCTNGLLPEKLKIGDICRHTFNSPETLNFRNILQPTFAIEPPTDVKNLWRFISHISMNFLSVANLKNFQEMLRQYIAGEDQDKSRLAANQKRIEGVASLKATPVNSIIRGVMMQGQKIDVEVRSEQFADLGDVYLFGVVLDIFFSAYISMNIFTQFNLKEINTGVIFRWPARVGNRILI